MTSSASFQSKTLTELNKKYQDAAVPVRKALKRLDHDHSLPQLIPFLYRSWKTGHVYDVANELVAVIATFGDYLDKMVTSSSLKNSSIFSSL